ncbi:hypothetical protein KY289_034366 [Solanum tuberosum]|nr:hypothetical protein KY289_034366 [Solanum tuberosum]KAH0646180.1 hypothetical protein KY284_034064 [Solanum tuberosum]
MMKSQGIQGPPSKFLHGNFKEIEEMRKDSINNAMDQLPHDIFPRILDLIYFLGRNYMGEIFSTGMDCNLN